MQEYINLIYCAIIIVVVFAFVYLPRKSQEKNLKKMQDALKTGDKIITYSGITGTIQEVSQENVIIEASPGKVQISIEKWAIAGIDDRN